VDIEINANYNKCDVTFMPTTQQVGTLPKPIESANLVQTFVLPYNMPTSVSEAFFRRQQSADQLNGNQKFALLSDNTLHFFIIQSTRNF
jgi:hypothetical protein